MLAHFRKDSHSPRRYKTIAADGSVTERTETGEVSQLSEFTPRKGDQGYDTGSDEEWSPRGGDEGASLALHRECKAAAKRLFAAARNTTAAEAPHIYKMTAAAYVC